MADRTGAAILLVDDNRTCLSLRKLMLEGHGYNVVAVEGAEGALLALQAERISLVILDYYLEGVTGTELARQIREIKAAVPILLLSGDGEITHGTEHVDRYLCKTDSFSVIEDTIAELLRRPGSCAA